ncbi:MAG TPA: hypothetical protein VIN75_22495, partial [Burkholderiaceae bacterium]
MKTVTRRALVRVMQGRRHAARDEPAPAHDYRRQLMTRSTRSRFWMALATALLATACDGDGPRELRVGLLVAQTGASGARGKDLVQGAMLAAE